MIQCVCVYIYTYIYIYVHIWSMNDFNKHRFLTARGDAGWWGPEPWFFGAVNQHIASSCLIDLIYLASPDIDFVVFLFYFAVQKEPQTIVHTMIFYQTLIATSLGTDGRYAIDGRPGCELANNLGSHRCRLFLSLPVNVRWLTHFCWSSTPISVPIFQLKNEPLLFRSSSSSSSPLNWVVSGP